jgi:CheY-like chemotaxis protein
VEETVDSFCATQKNTTINLKFDKKLYLVKANSSQIEQLFYNLLTSLTTGPDAASAVTISTANTSSQNMEGKKYDPIPGNYVLLTVQAKDKYISKEKVERIFEPLLSTHGDKEPPDLGLASIYSTIKSYGGYIDIEQNKKEGTIFFIYLPATDKKLSAIFESTEKFIKEKGTILLVDDEEAFLEVGRELIEALGYNVMIAKNGKEAVEIFKKNKAAIGLVLLDIIMPIMDGSEAFDQLRKIDPEVKVLLASGYSKDGAAKEILNRGCNGFIQKPFKMRDLSEKLTEIIAPP